MVRRDSNNTDELKLQQRLFRTEAGRKIQECIQCGTCSGSCPLTDVMDFAPRTLFALIRDGMMADVLRSNTPWCCVSCYQCVVRCPQEIHITDVLYTLKQMALQNGLSPARHKVPDLYRAFYRTVERSGRAAETTVMVRYGMRHPGDAIANISLGLRLLGKNRLGMMPANRPGKKRMKPLLTKKNGKRR